MYNDTCITDNTVIMIVGVGHVFCARVLEYRVAVVTPSRVRIFILFTAAVECEEYVHIHGILITPFSLLPLNT